MNPTTRPYAFFVLGLAMCATVSAAYGQSTPSSPPPPTSGEGAIVATVTGLRSDRGVVLMSLYDGPAHWASNTGYLYHCRAEIHNRQASCTFQPVQPGHAYGVAFSHDENGNGRFDTNFLGMPQEGYGFSNDVHPGLSVPGFDRCRFTTGTGTSSVRMTAQY